ncbi:MAG: MFS transporter [Flavisolibacter sp.]|nr:MFS transporter [Flavisolibacter sp.]
MEYINLAGTSLKRTSIGTLFLITFLDLLGMTMAIPILTPLVLDTNSGLLNANWNFQERSILLGCLIATYPFTSFFGATILGSLSDRYGRKRMLLLCLAGSLIGYLMFAFALIYKSVALIFVSQGINGFTGGNQSIIQSSVADISTEETKTKNFGLIGMAFGLGFILGPFIGGTLSSVQMVSWFSYSTPFFTAALFELVNIVLVVFTLQETSVYKNQEKHSYFKSIGNLITVFGSRRLGLLFTFIFLYYLGFNFFTEFFPAYLVQQFIFTAKEIGYFFAYVGIWLGFAQGVIVHQWLHKAQPKKIILLLLPMLAGSLLLLLLPRQIWWLGAFSIITAITQGILMPNTMTLISNSVLPSEQGKYLGINNSLHAASTVLPPVIAGYLTTIDIRLPTIVAAFLILIAWIVVQRAFKKQMS